MRSIAIVGTGIAGLACGHFLRGQFEVSIFEKNAYAGGHSNTVLVAQGDEQLPLDTGFMVYNEATYPNLTRLFAGLGVATRPTSMSFSVQHRPSGWEFCGSSLNQLFAQRRNLLNPRFIRMLLQIDRFNGEAVEALTSDRYRTMTLGDYARDRGYGDDFLQRYVIPMGAAVWSSPASKMMQFPAIALLRFFHNHGFLGMTTQHLWRTVVGGSREYVGLMTAPFRDQITLNSAAASVVRNQEDVEIRFEDGTARRFDAVILACHADEALALLDSPSTLESELLREFSYQTNTAIVHTDSFVMPKRKLAWSSWNYRVERGDGDNTVASTIYWMNSLQGVSKKQNYFVSINDPGLVDASKILHRIVYQHPLFSRGAIDAQARLPKLNAEGTGSRTFFCGSYFKYGFHEDALTSAVDLSQALLGRDPWERS